MQNKQDAQQIIHHIETIRRNNTESLENLNSINMLMVDNNYFIYFLITSVSSSSTAAL